MKKLTLVGCGSSGVFALNKLANILQSQPYLRNQFSEIQIIEEQKTSPGDNSSFGEVDCELPHCFG